MKIDLFHIGNIVIHGYGFMIGIGFILAIFLGELRAKYYKLKDDSIIDLSILCGITGFLGAKLLYIIVEFKSFLSDPLGVIGSAGFVVYGGLISGVFFGWLYTRIKKLSFREYFDLVMPEIALAQGFGRLGCFMAGCCYGRPTNSAIGVVFPMHSMAPAGVKLIPTQLISAGLDFLNCIILIIIAHKFSYSAKRLKNKEKSLHMGDIGSLYMIFYGIGRFGVEFLRNDYRGAIGPFSTSQFISLFIVLAGCGLMILNRKVFKDIRVEDAKVEGGVLD